MPEQRILELGDPTLSEKSTAVMEEHSMRGIWFLLALAILFGAPVAFGEDVGTSPIAGAWKVVQIDVISERGENSYPDPAPGLVIFGERHYSMVWMLLTEAPEAFEEIWKPTDEEKAAAFSSIIVNSGAYTLSDSLLTTFPTVAKTPEFIGGRATYAWSVSGDTLRLDMTDCLSSGGVRDPGVGVVRIPLTLVRVE